mgnify:CR=1 FL=1
MKNKIANADARSAVQYLKEFQGSNTEGVWNSPLTDDDTMQYVVYSYGTHWPMFIYENGRWYENGGKYSKTTSKHHNQLHPHTETEIRSAEDMRLIAKRGVVGLMQTKLSEVS